MVRKVFRLCWRWTDWLFAPVLWPHRMWTKTDATRVVLLRASQEHHGRGFATFPPSLDQ